jgi:hypothetical protein
MYVHSYKQKPIRLHFAQIYAETYCRRVVFAIKYKYKYLKNIYSLKEEHLKKVKTFCDPYLCPDLHMHVHKNSIHLVTQFL